MLRPIIFLLLALLVTIECKSQMLRLSSSSDSAKHYYRKGWEVIMDFGQYTLSEEYFRKALTFDPNFVLAQCQVARISKDEEERKVLLEKTENGIASTYPDEQLLIKNFIELIKLTNMRGKGDADAAKMHLANTLQLAEVNLKIFISKYPDEIYHNSEYIEVIHYQEGAEAALNQLAALNNEKLNQCVFIIGYSAMLHAETGEFKLANDKLNELSQKVSKTVPKYFVVKAQILEHQSKKKSALRIAKKALQIDPGNIDGQRIRDRNSE